VENMSRIKILAIVGSLRKDSYNKQLAMAVKDIINDRADFEILEFSDVPLMNEDIEFPPPEAVKRVREKVKQSDAIWFFTPEYNHFFTGVLKNLTDWLSRPVSETEPQVLAGKPAVISGISIAGTGTSMAQDHLVTLLSFLDMDIMNQPRLPIPKAQEQLDEAGKLKLTTSLPFVNAQVDAFLDFVHKRMN